MERALEGCVPQDDCGAHHRMHARRAWRARARGACGVRQQSGTSSHYPRVYPFLHETIILQMEQRYDATRTRAQCVASFAKRHQLAAAPLTRAQA
jgi:hypothetical protein